MGRREAALLAITVALLAAYVHTSTRPAPDAPEIPDRPRVERPYVLPSIAVSSQCGDDDAPQRSPAVDEAQWAIDGDPENERLVTAARTERARAARLAQQNLAGRITLVHRHTPSGG